MTIKEVGSTVYVDNKNDLARVASIGLVPSWATGPGRKAGGEAAEAGANLYHALARDLDAYQSAAAALGSDKMLTKAGQVVKRGQTAQAALERLGTLEAGALAKLRSKRDDARERAGKATESVFPDAVTRAIVWSKMIDLLDRAEVADPLHAGIAYRDALERGDAALLETLESLPSLHPAAMPADQLDTLRSERLASVNPALGQELGHLNEIVGDLERIGHTARSEMERAVTEAANLASKTDNSARVDEVARIAAGLETRSA